ncbi:hypothetical protein H4R24_004023 [Coemansia sp. RSA 988]|nr:hypothetical protein H4R24_004023 [Coemansia sp. RSA 988]
MALYKESPNNHIGNEPKKTSDISGGDFDAEMDSTSGDTTTTEIVDWLLSRFGTKDYDGYFLYNSTDHGVEVDRSLICKALFGIGAQVVRVCVPNGFGKSHNLNVLMCFNVLTKFDLPCPNMRVNYGHHLNEQTIFDAAEAYRSREGHLKESLLFQEAPVFFEKHFAVIRPS